MSTSTTAETGLSLAWRRARWALWVAAHNSVALTAVVWVLLSSRVWALRGRGPVRAGVVVGLIELVPASE